MFDITSIAICTIFTIAFTPCIYVLLAYDFDYSRWKVSPSDIVANTVLILGSLFLAYMVSILLTMVWPVVVAVLVLTVVAFGLAFLVKRYGKW
jgi:uncharacterized protein YacL